MTDLPINDFNQNPEPEEPPTFEPTPIPNPFPPAKPFEDLSLAEVLGLLIRRPGSTLARLGQTLQPEPSELVDDSTLAQLTDELEQAWKPERPESIQAASVVKAVIAARPPRVAQPVVAVTGPAAIQPVIPVPPPIAVAPLETRSLIILGVLGLMLIMAILGGLMLAGVRNIPVTDGLPVGFFLLVFAAIGTGVIGAVEFGFRRLSPLEVAESPTRQFEDLSEFLAANAVRLVLAGLGLVFSALTWVSNYEVFGDGIPRYNHFTDFGVLCWIISIITVAAALYDKPIHPLRWLGQLLSSSRNMVGRTLNFRVSWTLIAMIVILATGAWFRFSNLSAYPPDMTSDHKEKALDAEKVYDGLRPVFFPNNGGRESFQMYYLAELRSVTGWPISFDLLKLGSGLEGMVMIILAWFLGRAVIGEEDRALGNLTGVIMAALVATSYWHTMLSRLGLRIVTTPIIMTLILIFFVQALRYNRRRDFLLTGFTLGAGMYFYQADRMIPLIIIIGFILAILVRARSRQAMIAYGANTMALVILSLVVFIPLGRYMVEYPDSFWQRTGGRLFGDPEIEIRDSSNNIIERRPVPFSERIKAFQKNFPTLFQNLERSAAMFNWQGDRAFITGDKDAIPELDTITGAFFAMGIGILVLRIIRRRDPFDWLLPFALFIMLLPTALAISQLQEVPSATRASGALPIVYLIAALTFALILQTAVRLLRTRPMRYLVYIGGIVLITLSAASNSDSYFVTAMTNYRESTAPYRQAGNILKGFRESVGAAGNAFMVSYNYWWDHRIIGIESGDPDWNNGLFHDNLKNRIIEMIKTNNGTAYELRPDRQLLFFVHLDDQEALNILNVMFPAGIVTHISTFNPANDFLLYTSQPVGCGWIRDNIAPKTTYCTDVTPTPTGQ